MSNTASNITPNILGWDIGGAHLKVVLLDTKGHVIRSVQLPCPLWKGLDFLQRAIIDALAQLNQAVALHALNIELSSACHAITMTGELVDLFENRHQGVCEIAKVAADLLGEQTLFYAANIGFVPLQGVAAVTENIASTNWHASASALALHVQDALFVDIGSTTTDIIAIEDGKVANEGLSDAYRLAADSLVYTGVVRTPVMALAQKLVVEGNKINVAAEYFATMADVYRLTGELLPHYDMAETADGKGKTPLESARRLARMIGLDVDACDFYKEREKWIKLAFTCRGLQIQQIKTAMLKQLKQNMPIIGAGAGSFLVKAIADDLGRHCMHVFEYAWDPISIRASRMNNQLELVYSAGTTLAVAGLSNLVTQHDIEVCFPAYAVAYLRVKSAFTHKI